MELNKADFAKLVAWLGPEALAAHKKYPFGHRYFDTGTRIFRYNIDPNDYYEITPGVPGVCPPKVGRTVPAAYKAMRAVIEALQARNVRYRIVKVSWAGGGSYIEAIMPPKPVREATEEICDVCGERLEYGQEEVCGCDLL